jgi:protein tyrosine/serine phosphatase
MDFPLDANPTTITEDDICNFHQVDPDVYRGGRPRPSAFPKLVRLGIRTILDLELTNYAERDRAAIAELNSKLPPEQRIAFISFPIYQDEIEVSGISHARLQDLFRHFREARKPILVQCYLGRDRTGLLVAVYRLLQRQKSYDEAYAEAVHYKFYPGDSGLKRTLDRYKSAKRLESLIQP